MIGLYTLSILNFILLIILGFVIINYFNQFKKEQKVFKKFLKLNNKFLESTSKCITNIHNYISNEERNNDNSTSPDEIAQHILKEYCSGETKEDINNLLIVDQPLSLFVCVRCSSEYVYRLVKNGLDLNKSVRVKVTKKGKKAYMYPLQFLIDKDRLDVIKKLHTDNKINIDINIKSNDNKEVTVYEYCIRNDKYHIAKFIGENSKSSVPLIDKEKLN